MLNVADVSRLHAMLCHKPKLVSDTSIAHWRAPWLPKASEAKASEPNLTDHR
jgi:hypothetical protein